MSPRLPHIARLLCSAALFCLLVPSAASAAPPAPEVYIHAPDSVEAGEPGMFGVFIFHNSDEPLAGPITITETLSAGSEQPEPSFGETAIPELKRVTGQNCEQSGLTWTCTLSIEPPGLPGGVMLYRQPQLLTVEPGSAEEVTIAVRVESGNAPTVQADRSVRIGAPGPFELGWAGALLKPDRSPFTAAGSTPHSFFTDLKLSTYAKTLFGGLVPGVLIEEKLDDAVAHLPAGLVGNPQAIPTCPYVELQHAKAAIPNCPPDSQVGLFKGMIGGAGAFGPRIAPIYNVEPPAGAPASFGMNIHGVPILLTARLDPDDYSIDVASTNTNTTLALTDARIEIWGVPHDKSHDGLRVVDCLEYGSNEGGSGESCPSGHPRTAFLRTPTRCDGPLDVGLEASTYQHPELVHRESFELPALQACDKVPFNPSLDVKTSSLDAESATGLRATVEAPNSGLENPDAVSESDIKEVKVSLPQGVTLNPSQADGLGVCSEAQFENSELSFNPDGSKGCPSNSKIGTVSVKTPLLAETIPGNVYVAEPYLNPFDSLLAIYVVLEEPMRGILVKLTGEVESDERTGRIVTTFSDLPQQPFSSFEFRFREGARAPLVTPPTCGTYETEAQFVPWANPSETLVSKSSFQITRGIGGGPCPPGGVPGFNPGFTAGSVNNNAGSFSPFLMRLTRLDGEQDMTKFSSVLPPGVVAKIAGVGKCSQAAIDAAEAETGLEERANPSCPASSQIGRTLVGAGVGSVLTQVPGKLYLAGPYKGAPLSVAAITPAVAGPFDVGTVVVQEALTLDPITAEVHVDGDRSEPIPHILKGIPLKMRDLRVYVDRDKFTLNPTSCDPSSVKATLFGSNLDVFSDADDVAVNLASRYQAANCANLGFKPRLSLRLKGGTGRGAHPGLRAVFRPRPGDANLAKAVVKLPRSAFLDQAHIRTICTRVQWATDNCPKGAIYGRVMAFTPLLEEPLKGNAYLRSSNNKLPDLVFDLEGVVDIEAAARIDSVGGGIRATFSFIPDAPLTKVVVEMQGAKKGLIVNSRNLCAGKSRAELKLDGHNGKAADSRPVVRARCGKGKRRRN